MKHLAASLLLVIAMYGYGMWRMPENAAPSTLRVRVVQPNIEQAMKWKPEGKVEAMRRLTQLSHIRTDAEVPGVIIWPETAMPYLLEGSENWPVMMDTFVPPGAALITGVLRKERGASRIYNSVIAVFPHGKQFVLYNKHQLVPFGEFVPLRDVLPLDKITPGNTDFSRGNGPETLATSFAGAFSALICYEAIFPDLSVAETRPEWLLNVTNDAWFGNSPGPYQHADMVRIRAIEQGLPLVRAANTGISMVVDPYGRILKSLSLGDIGIMDQTLPKSLHATVYAQNFRVTPFFLLLVGLVSLTAIRRKVTPTSQSPYA
jgi:apolipoprotein N-acyltransferase